MDSDDTIVPPTDEELFAVIQRTRAEMEEEVEYEVDQVVVLTRHGPGLICVESSESDDVVAAILGQAFVQYNQSWLDDESDDEEEEDDEEDAGGD